MVLPKFHPTAYLSIFSAVILVAGLGIAVIGLQQKQDNRSHASTYPNGGECGSDGCCSDPNRGGWTGAMCKYDYEGACPGGMLSTAHPWLCPLGDNYRCCKDASPVANAGGDQTITLPTSSVTLNGGCSDDDTDSRNLKSCTWAKVSGNGGSIVSPSSGSTAVTGLQQGSYTFQLTASDGYQTASDTVVVTVNPTPDQPPTAPTNLSGVAKSSTQIDLTWTASTDDKGVTGYKIFRNATLVGSSTTTSFSDSVGLVPSTQYTYTVSAYDASSNNSPLSGQTQVTTLPANKPPVANAGAAQTIVLPTTSVTLSATGSTDPDGSVVGFVWTQTDGPVNTTISTPNFATTKVNGLTDVGDYTFTLEVTDNSGAKDTATVVVTVKPTPNKPPVVSAGTDQTVVLPTDSVTLPGTATDSDGSLVSILWTKQTGPVNGTILDPNSPNTGVSGLIKGTYVFRLTATDDQGATTSDDVTVNVVTAQSTSVTLDLFLHGVGKAGDSANPTGGGGNTSLVHLQRPVVVELYDVQNNKISPDGGFNGLVIYNTTSGSFKGTIDLGDKILSGLYIMKVKLTQSLQTQLVGVQNIFAGTDNVLPQRPPVNGQPNPDHSTTLVNGDINNDNAVNILDYDVLIGCYSDLLPATNCSKDAKLAADITDDGNVNQYDYNLFIRELSNRGGQ